MKKTLFKQFIYLFSLLIGATAFTACGDDEPSTPDVPEETTPVDPPEESDEDEYKYDIVGVWEAYYQWTYSTEHIILDIRSNGTLSCSTTYDNDNTPWSGTGSWTYNKKNTTWTLSTGSSMISGDYIIINGQLICNQYFQDGTSRTITYNRVSDNNSDSKIKQEDFIGAWYHSSGAYVFDLKEAGLADMYILKSWKGDKYTEKSTGIWEFDPKTNLLKITTFKGIIEDTVTKTNFPSDFTTKDGTWSACRNLPTSESGSDNNNGNQSGDKEDELKYSNYYAEYYGNNSLCCETEITDLVMGVELFAGGGNSHIKYLRLFDKKGKGVLSLEKHYDGATIPNNDRWDPGEYQIIEVAPNLFLHNPIIISRPHSALVNDVGTVNIRYVGSQIIFEFNGTHSYNEYETVKAYFKGSYYNMK